MPYKPEFRQVSDYRAASFEVVRGYSPCHFLVIPTVNCRRYGFQCDPFGCGPIDGELRNLHLLSGVSHDQKQSHP